MQPSEVPSGGGFFAKSNCEQQAARLESGANASRTAFPAGVRALGFEFRPRRSTWSETAHRFGHMVKQRDL
jgi:hypothetical protein